jgi:sugar (pentulose or hexulose) kinase
MPISGIAARESRLLGTVVEKGNGYRNLLIYSELAGICHSDCNYLARVGLLDSAPKLKSLARGTRAQPELRASWSGMSAENFTPACLVRALFEGMARSFRGGFEMMTRRTSQTPKRLVGAGNGLRESPILAKIVAETFEMPLLFPQHREEAAVGAALLAAVGAKIIPDLATAGRGIRFSTPFL